MKNVTSYAPSFSGRKAVVEKDQRNERGTGCTAYGCTRAGTVSNTAGEDAKFVCWAHDRVNDSNAVQGITAAIHSNASLMDFIDTVSVASWIDLEHGGRQEQFDATLRAKGPETAKLARRVGEDGKLENRSVWISRLRNYAWWVLNGRPEADRRIALK